MLNFRNLSYENDAGNEHHLQNGVTQNGVTLNGVTQNGVTLNSVTQNGVTQNGAIVNNIRNSLHKRDVQTSNGTVSEHNPPDQTFMSRDYPHVQEPPFNRPNRCRWRCKITANAIDAWSRVLFPLAYGLFIVAYWIIYSSANADKKSQWMRGNGNMHSIPHIGVKTENWLTCWLEIRNFISLEQEKSIGINFRLKFLYIPFWMTDHDLQFQRQLRSSNGDQDSSREWER